jgi:hypothetical protein
MDGSMVTSTCLLVWVSGSMYGMRTVCIGAELMVLDDGPRCNETLRCSLLFVERRDNSGNRVRVILLVFCQR